MVRMNTQIDSAIQYFDGIQAMADRLGVDRTNVSKWRTRGHMPARHAIAVELLSEGAIKAASLVQQTPSAAASDSAAMEVTPAS